MNPIDEKIAELKRERFKLQMEIGDEEIGAMLVDYPEKCIRLMRILIEINTLESLAFEWDKMYKERDEWISRLSNALKERDEAIKLLKRWKSFEETLNWGVRSHIFNDTTNFLAAHEKKEAE